MIPVTVGEKYFFRTPTFFYVGVVKEVTVLGVTLAPGGYQVNLLNDLSTFLEKGTLAEGDELVPLPQETTIPSLWVGPYNLFPFATDWGRTHQPARVRR